MAKDYAKASSQKSPLATSGWRRRLLLVLLLLLLLLLSGAGVVAYQKYANQLPVQAFSRWVTHIKSVMVKQHTQPAPTVAHNEQTTAETEPEIKFNFYNELPNMQVTLPEKQKTSDNTAKPVAEAIEKVAAIKKSKSTAQYIVQLGAYESESAASEVRVSLLLAGIEVDIVEEQAADKPVFRIQQGFYTTHAEAESALKKLNKKGVDGIVKKIN